MIQTVPIKQLQKYYSQPVEVRVDSIFLAFKQEYGHTPDFIARAPGRVNIIGEHIDYQGYGVLPAAIEKDCLIAFKRVKSQTIKICHAIPEMFPSVEISKYPSELVVADVEQRVSYVKYFMAGYRAGILDLVDDQKIVGLQILIEGNIPWASGISSSSALCVCSAMVASYANRTAKIISKQQFVERCIKFQREVGTASGGMDQSISFFGKKSCCLYIQFNPIRTQKVEVPLQGYKIIIMNSLVQSAKMQTAVYRYNKRVCQCRIATHVLAKNCGIPKQVYGKWTILKQLQQYMKKSLGQMLQVVKQKIPRKSYTLQQLQKILGVHPSHIVSDIQRNQQVLEKNKQFKIYEAAYHVYSQANRVLEFINTCRSDLKGDQKIKMLGKLMNESQESCRDLYQCSCPQLDQLTSLALKHGALGSRLTGAGWGGCTVSIVPAQKQHQFIQTIKKQYYGKPGMKQKAKLGIHNAIFATQPSEGAFVIDVLL